MAQYTPQDLIDNLNYLNETKQLIKSSIINKGQEIDDNDTFRSYADKIDNIATDTTATENDITINKSAYINGNKVIGTYDINDTYKNILYNYIINAVEGETIHITDSANLPMILEPHGNIQQDTRDGYNLGLYDKETTIQNEVTFTHNEDGSMNVNGTSNNYTTFALNKEPITLETGTYTFAYIQDIATIGDIHFDIRNTLGNALMITYLNADLGNWKVKELVLEETTEVNYVYYISNGLSVNNQNFKFMLLKGTYTVEDLPEYEEYGISPSKEYPSKIKYVEGDNGILIEEDIETAEVQSQNLSLTLPEGIKLYGKEDGFVYLTEEQATELKVDGEGWYTVNNYNERNFSKEPLLTGKTAGPFSQGYYLIFDDIKNRASLDGNIIYSTHQKQKVPANPSTDTEWQSLNGNLIGQLYPSIHTGVYINYAPETKQEFVDWFNNLAPTIVYPVEKAVYTKIADSTLISQLESLKKVFSHYPVTNIDNIPENENAPIYFNVTYFKIK